MIMLKIPTKLFSMTICIVGIAVLFVSVQYAEAIEPVHTIQGGFNGGGFYLHPIC